MIDAIRKVLSVRNVGPMDRVLRALPALVVAVLVLDGSLSGPLAWLLGALAAALLVTSAFGSCSVYYMLGWSTCPLSNRAGQ